MNEHPEDLRLAGAGALDVTLYSRPGCHLCEAAKAAIDPLLSEFGATLHEINIDRDAVLTERYGWDTSGLFLGTRKAAKHRINVRQLRRQLKEARENAENSQAVLVRKK